ncbi:MAG: DUF2892 domain-containing protein [Bacteroidota bacterium]|nr:DUF2892 domain-containing protein [Bacteroidota bacterium]
MKTNIGAKDKTLRILFGILIVGVGVFYNNWWGLVGLIPIITAVIGWCPLYALLGINSLSKEELKKRKE